MMRARQDEVMVRTLAFMIVRQVLCLVGLGPSPDAKDIEIAVLRHQLAVVRRQVARPRYTPADRMILATLAKLLPRDRWPIFLVTPSTLLRWHRELIRRRWTYPTRGRRRRTLDPEVADLVLRLARVNPRWGYMRIVGECRKLGVRVSATARMDSLSSCMVSLHNSSMGLPSGFSAGCRCTVCAKVGSCMLAMPMVGSRPRSRMTPTSTAATVRDLWVGLGCESPSVVRLAGAALVASSP